MTEAPPLVVVAGETATGKTELAIRLGEAVLSGGRSVAVISADSRQVFRGLDIGTAKVTVPAYADPKDKSGKLVVVELAPDKKLKRPVTLAEIKASGRFPDWALVRIPRLSVMPVTDDQWEAIEAMTRE